MSPYPTVNCQTVFSGFGLGPEVGEVIIDDIENYMAQARRAIKI